MSDKFPVIYANWIEFFKGTKAYFFHNAKPKYISDYMDGLNKDIRARNNEKIAAAEQEGRDKPKVAQHGPPYGPDELEPENTTCAIQVSQGMNSAGVMVPGLSNQRPNGAIPGGNGFYIHNVSEMTNFLTYKYGETPNLKSLSSDAEGEIKDRKGILTFGKVHTELYNGQSIVQSGAINEELNRATVPIDRGATWGQADIRFWEIRPPEEKGKSTEIGSFLNGWWSVYDGNQYYYYFAPPYVVYTKTKPAPTAGAPYKSANQGTVKPGKDNTYIVTWKPIPGDPDPTVETFWLIWGETRKMNAKSSKYSMIYAEKITPEKTN